MSDQLVKTDSLGNLKLVGEDGTQSAVPGLCVTEVQLTNAQVKALRATPQTLVAAPGSGKILQFVAACLVFDYTAAWTESADNLGVRYNNGSGVQVSDTIEATGFLDATADTITFARAAVDGIVAASAGANKSLVLHNLGDGEYGGGDASNVLWVRTYYRVHPTHL